MTSVPATLAATLAGWAGRLEQRLGHLSRPAYVGFVTWVALGLSILCYSPKFRLWPTAGPDTVEWGRAHGVMVQAQAPLDLKRPGVETALRWRILPALVVQGLGGGVAPVVLLPWAGLVALVASLAWWLDRAMPDRLAGLFASALLGTTGAVVTVTNFLGINDAWFLLPLCAVVFSPHLPVLFVAGLAGPWVEERFLLALPLAWLVRQLVHPGWPSRATWLAVGTGPALYVLVRLGATLSAADISSAEHLATHRAQWGIYLPYAPYGWLMGYRFGWILLAMALLTIWRQSRFLGATLLLAGGAGLAANALVAADLTRSTSLLLPLAACCLPWLQRQWGAPRLRRVLGLVLAGNLLTPLVWVTYTHCILLWPFPIEVWRWLR